MHDDSDPLILFPNDITGFGVYSVGLARIVNMFVYLSPYDVLHDILCQKQLICKLFPDMIMKHLQTVKNLDFSGGFVNYFRILY